MFALFHLLQGLAILSGLLLPGLAWARGRGWPAPWLAGGVVSVLLLFSAVLGMAVCDVPVTAWSLALWQSAWLLGGVMAGRNCCSAPEKPFQANSKEWWLALPSLPMLGVMAWRAITQPLPGVDIDFRWNRVAEIIVQSAGLSHYPPILPEDFIHYFWPDGIAPVVSSLYAWSYLLAGEVDKTWTAWPVLLQSAGLMLLLRELGKCWEGARGGWLACALGGSTMLLQFAFNLGQETGLTALGVGGMTFYLIRWQRAQQSEWLIPAAACASLAACAREYGVIYPVVGAFWVWVEGRRTIITGLFAGGALFLPALWYCRNWWLTGNPFYALEVAGWVSPNPVFGLWMRGYRQVYGAPLHHAAGWWEIGRMLSLTALPALAGGLVGAWWWRRSAGWFGCLTVAAATGACWIVSVPYTAGGLFYSMRVLSPLLVLGCAWGGAWLAVAVPGKKHLGGLLLGCGLFATDAALRALTIPANPYQSSPRQWLRVGYELQDEFSRTNEPFLQEAARIAQGRTLSESAAAQGIFRAAGHDLVPVWSPELAFLFQPGSKAEKLAQLRALGFSHMLLTRSQFSVDFFQATGILSSRLRVVMANNTFILLTWEAAQDAI